jgi:hypothetical protein
VANLVIPHDLVDGLRRGRAHLFVGSGASSAAGLTSWDNLISEMKTTIRKENTSFPLPDLDAFLNTADHLDIADLFRQTVQDHRYFAFLRSHYRRDVRPSRLHRAVAALGVGTTFTTNYDKLLELSLRQGNGLDPAVIVHPEQLGYIDETETRVVKLHGDIDHPSSIVLTRSDYSRYGSRHREFELQFHAAINDHTMLFIGFGLRDVNFRRIYQDARSLYDSGKRLAYAIMAGTNSVQRGLWERDGLRIIPVSRNGAIPTALRDLRSLAFGGAP